MNLSIWTLLDVWEIGLKLFQLLRPERRFYHGEMGFNFRLTNLQAALGLAQKERSDEIVARKRWIGKEDSRRLKGLPG